jgi:hypothetical protein
LEAFTVGCKEKAIMTSNYAPSDFEDQTFPISADQVDRNVLASYGFMTQTDEDVEAARMIFRGYTKPVTALMLCPLCHQTMRVDVIQCPHCGTEFIAPADPAVNQTTLNFQIGETELAIPVETTITLGRGTDRMADGAPHIDLTDYAARDKGVSRHHVKITRRNNRLWVSDLGSTNGTLLNGRPLPPDTERPLSNGDELYLSYLKLVIKV